MAVSSFLQAASGYPMRRRGGGCKKKPRTHGCFSAFAGFRQTQKSTTAFRRSCFWALRRGSDVQDTPDGFPAHILPFRKAEKLRRTRETRIMRKKKPRTHGCAVSFW
jgi:hypothetical protein